MPQEPFETFIWKGQMRYRCGAKWESGAACQYDTQDKAALIKHMASPHLRAAPVGGSPSIAAPLVPMSVSGTEAQAAEFRDAKFAEQEDE